MKIKRLAVYCGSSSGRGPAYLEAAQSLGNLLAHKGIKLIFGGGNIGLMGALSTAVMQAGGEAIGVMPQALAEHDIAHSGLTEFKIVNSMHERKQMMFDLADAFVALPGGLGTWEEILEVLTWLQLGFHKKPCGFLNIKNYYQGLITQLQAAEVEGFIHAEHRKMLVVEEGPERLLEALEIAKAPSLDKILEFVKGRR